MTIVMDQIMTCCSSYAGKKSLMSLVIKRLKFNVFKYILKNHKL